MTNQTTITASDLQGIRAAILKAVAVGANTSSSNAPAIRWPLSFRTLNTRPLCASGCAGHRELVIASGKPRPGLTGNS